MPLKIGGAHATEEDIAGANPADVEAAFGEFVRETDRGGRAPLTVIYPPEVDDFTIPIAGATAARLLALPPTPVMGAPDLPGGPSVYAGAVNPAMDLHRREFGHGQFDYFKLVAELQEALAKELGGPGYAPANLGVLKTAGWQMMALLGARDVELPEGVFLVPLAVGGGLGNCWGKGQTKSTSLRFGVVCPDVAGATVATMFAGEHTRVGWKPGFSGGKPTRYLYFTGPGAPTPTRTLLMGVTLKMTVGDDGTTVTSCKCVPGTGFPMSHDQFLTEAFRYVDIIRGLTKKCAEKSEVPDVDELVNNAGEKVGQCLKLALGAVPELAERSTAAV